MGNNISKEKRERIIGFLNELKNKNSQDPKTQGQINAIEDYVNRMKYGLVFEEHEETVLTMLKDNVPVLEEDPNRRLITDKKKPLNFIIEGDNLHALEVLSKTHKRSFDVIYIDPPFNSGAKTWKYNNDFVDKLDDFKHSKWLSIMANRIDVAKDLLKDDGVFICAIDENELATSILLIQEKFGDAYKTDVICIVINPRGQQGDNFSYVNEYAIFVYKKGLKVIEDSEIEEDDVDWSNLRNWGSESLRTDAANCFYPIFVKDGKVIGCGQVPPDDFHPKQTEYDPATQTYSVYPIDISGIEHKWRYATQSFDQIKDIVSARENGPDRLEIYLGKPFGTYRTVWTDKKYDANEYGTQLIKDMVPGCDFPYPKSLYNVYECLYAVIKNRPNARVLDFFAGSGTTGHAVLLMNKKLGGNRSFILCTNNDVGYEKEKEFVKEHPECLDENGYIKTDAEEWKTWEERFGIARSVTFPRIKAAIQGYQTLRGNKTIIFEKPLTPKLLSDKDKLDRMLSDAQVAAKKVGGETTAKIEDDCYRVYSSTTKKETVPGLGGNVVYFKTNFVEKFSSDFDLSEMLLKYVQPLIELKRWSFPEDNSIIITDDDYANVLKDLSSHSGQPLFVSSRVLITEEDKEKINSEKIELVVIPDFFFSSELSEVGEKWSE